METSATWWCRLLRLVAGTHAHERVSTPNVLNITTFYTDVKSINDATSEKDVS